MSDTAKASAAIKQTFDTVADVYDSPVLRFFPASAAHMATRVDLRGDEQVLDVACGTGHASLAFARRLPHGRVTAVDFSRPMLAQARRKAASAAVTNIDFVEGDMQALPWQGRFDVAACAFGIFFVEDMNAQLRRMVDTVKPGGRVIITNFAKDYMDPLRAMMVQRLAHYGVQAPPQHWLHIAYPDGCRAFFEGAGLRDVEVESKNVGYFLANAEQWWEVMWNAGFRRMLSLLPAVDLPKFKAEHLAEIEQLRTTEGIRMNIEVLFTSGTRGA